jgi:hypothetical protein
MVKWSVNLVDEYGFGSKCEAERVVRECDVEIVGRCSCSECGFLELMEILWHCFRCRNSD